MNRDEKLKLLNANNRETTQFLEAKKIITTNIRELPQMDDRIRYVLTGDGPDEEYKILVLYNPNTKITKHKIISIKCTK